MADAAEDDRERLKSALWYAVGQIVDEECLRRNRNATPQFIGALTEMVWTQIGKLVPSSSSPLQREGEGEENVAIDLESFAHHASRPNITTEDVLLLARKNPDLQQIMSGFVEERKGIREARTGKDRHARRR
ncbi:Histone-fold protein [Metarhizium rileyi]|uniref:Histone-fold protein n=1 Tax=Metarhizium rileyi (strain RCEF 4871) TaxID=1649241 RepID=A0A167B7L3_METRR|nr:Histone-fold protein [Metarhizium rileyi RCEF 4871]TWU75385.1 hypothetical protein ED733_001574 [Metarhizium rileyi]